MNGYQRRTEAKKEAILETARRLFAARGLQDVSIKEIAATAKVSQVTIYHYFGDKASLAQRSFVDYVEIAMCSFEATLAEDIPFAEKIERIISGKQEIIGSAVLSFFSQQALADPSFLQLFGAAVRDRAKAIYRQTIEQGQNEGVIDPKIPLETLLTYMELSLALFENSEFMATSATNKSYLLSLFLYGLIGSPKAISDL